MKFQAAIAVAMLILLAGVGRAGELVSEAPAKRIASREFPSVFQAWNAADNLKEEDPWTTLARHDLVFHAPEFFGLKWDGQFAGLATRFDEESRQRGLQRRHDLLAKNPHLIMLAELRYRDAHRSYLPGDHPWWRRADGKIVSGWAEGGYLQLDFSNPAYRAQVARQARAIMETGVFDGIMLDWWQDDDDRLALAAEIRKQIGGDALILVNANDHTTPRTADLVNGYFMECYKSQTADDWKQIADTLAWAEKRLKEPHINCLETWFHHSRQDLNLMRATTTLSLTLSDGYCLFSDPNPLPTPDHLHDWYPFWDTSLGHPKAAGQRQADGSIHREFDGGLAVYNPLGNRPVKITFTTPRKAASSGQAGVEFAVPAEDGDLFLTIDAK